MDNKIVLNGFVNKVTMYCIIGPQHAQVRIKIDWHLENILICFLFGMAAVSDKVLGSSARLCAPQLSANLPVSP
jgi:hypothetical protein